MRLVVHKMNRFESCIAVWKQNKARQGTVREEFNFDRNIISEMSLRKCSSLCLTRLAKAVALVICKRACTLGHCDRTVMCVHINDEAIIKEAAKLTLVRWDLFDRNWK